MPKLHMNLVGWLSLALVLYGLIAIIAGQFTFPTTDGWAQIQGPTARIAGLGLTAVFCCFLGSMHFKNSSNWVRWSQRALVIAGVYILFRSFAYVVRHLPPDQLEWIPYTN